MAQTKLKLRQLIQDGAVTNATVRFDGTDWASTDDLRITSGGQLILPSYTSSSSFTGTVAGLLAFDSSGNILTTAQSNGDILNGGNTTGSTVVIGTNDNNSLSFETNNTIRLTIDTTGAITDTVTSSSTDAAVPVLTARANSSGTPTAAFGPSIAFAGESSTTDNRDMGSISSLWATATDASRVSNLVYRIGNTTGGLVVARMAPNAFTVNESNVTLTSSGLNASSANITVAPIGASASSITNGGSQTSTSLAKTIASITGSYTASSGAGTMTALALTPTYDLTSATGTQILLDLNPTITNLGPSSSLRAINIPVNDSSSFGIYQSGNATSNYLQGSTSIGTSTIDEKLRVSGSVRFDLGSDATGDTYYRDSSGRFTRRAIGSSGQVLTVSSGLPTWTTPSTTFSDSLFRVQDNGDATKQLAFEVSGVTTGTTRTLTVPNSSGTIALGTGTNGLFTSWSGTNTLTSVSADRITFDGSNKMMINSSSANRALNIAPYKWTIPAVIFTSDNTTSWRNEVAVAYGGIQNYATASIPTAGESRLTVLNNYGTYLDAGLNVRSPLAGDFPFDFRVYATRGTSAPYDPYDDGVAYSVFRSFITDVDASTKHTDASTVFYTRKKTDGSLISSGGGNQVLTLKANQDIQLHNYPNTRDDAGSPTNFLSTDGSGNLISNPVSILSGGIVDLNGLTDATQTFATGTSGTDFNISSASGTHTFNIPSASFTARGLITTGAQNIAGIKSFNSAVKMLLTGEFGVDSSVRGSAIFHTTDSSVTLQGSNSTTADYTLTLPTTAGSSGQILSTDGTGVLSWINPSSGGTPAGSNTQIQFNNGGSFGASTNFEWVDASTRLDIGSPASPGTSRIVVKTADNTATAFSFQQFNNSDVERLRLTNSGVFQGSGLSRLAFDMASFFDATARMRQPFDTPFTGTSGTTDLLHQYSTFAPTSGTGTFNGLYINQQINQTGGSSGITRGIFVDPALTAAADFRAIETTVGKIIFGGTDAVRIPVGTTAQRPTGVEGMIRRNTTTSAWEGFDGTTWGALAAGSGVSDGDKGDITVSGSGATWTIDNSAVTSAKFRDSAGLSVVGRSTNTTGVVADITAASDGQVLRRSGTALGFGTISSAGIANDAVTSNKIAANNVTLDKIITINTDSLLGRDTAGTGNVENIGLNSTLEMTGTGSLQRAALTGDVTASAGSNTTSLANGTVSTAKIVDGAVTNIKINDVAASKLTSGTLPSSFAFGTTTASTARINYSGGNPSLITSNSANETTIFSQDGEQYVTTNNTLVSLGSGTSKLDFIDGELRIYDSDSTNYVGIKTPATGSLTANYTLTLPTDDGTANQVLTTNGTGTLSWTTPSGGGSSPSVLSFSQFTSDQDNLTASGIADATVLRVSGNNSIVAITSIDATGMADGKEISIVNTGSQPIILQAEHPDGTATNRFSGNGDVILAPRSNVRVVRDGTSERFWLPPNILPQGLRLYKRQWVGSGSSTTVGDYGEITFINSSGTVTAGSLSNSKPPGVILGTGSNASGSISMLLSKSPNTIMNPGDAYSYMKIVLQTSADLSDATNTYSIYGGWMQNTTGGSATSQQSVYVHYSHGSNSGKWSGITRTTSGVETIVDLGVTVAASTAYTLEIYWNKANNEVRFFVDGEYKGRSTANIPSSSNNLNPAIGIGKSLGTAARNMILTASEYWMLFPY